MTGDAMLFGGTRSTAVVSDDGRYRYALSREWTGGGGHATFIMLSPSTADASQDDPTIRRCIGFARSWGLDGLTVVNLYAYRATNPSSLREAPDPVGPDNDQHIALALAVARVNGTPVVAAWGAHAGADRIERVRRMSERLDVPLLHLGLTKAGQPKHPLYLRADTEAQILTLPPSSENS